MPAFGLQLAQAAAGQSAGNFINEAYGITSQPIKNKQQLKQARRLQDLSLEAEATRLQRNKKYALEMWEATGYGAQVEQMKKAGINPALLYGMSGGGGQTANVPPAATSNTNAPTAQASRGSEGMGMMIGQMALLQAQKENIEADTAKKKAETPNIEQDTENKKAQESLTRVQTEIAQVQASVSRQTIMDQMKAIENAAKKGTEEIEALQNSNAITYATMEDTVLKIKAEAIGAMVENALKQSNIEVNKQEVVASAEKLLQGWQQLDIEGQKVAIQKFAEEYKANHPGVFNLLGGAIQRLANSVAKPKSELKVENKK